MATFTTFEQQYKDRQPDWKGMIKRRFRWSTFKFEYGRYCYVVHPIEGHYDYVWWEWENNIKKGEKL